MKFKNYRNPKTKENVIYSNKNLLDMSLREIFSRKDELLAQNKVLGIPNERELSSSSNVVYVHPYTRDDGTEVKAHWRSKPNKGSSEYNDVNTQNVKESNIEISKQKKQEYIEREKEKSIVRNDPGEIAGVKHGEPKTFIEMMQQGVNPKYRDNEDNNGSYSKNCQSCNVACELVIRGYDVEASSYETPESVELSKNGQSAYLDKETGEMCEPKEILLPINEYYDFVEDMVQKGARYEFSYHITPEGAEYSNTESHTVFMTRLDNGKIIIYDGQNGETAYGEQEVKSYINSFINEDNTKYPPKILRVDDKQVNPYYTNKVVRARGRNH